MINLQNPPAMLASQIYLLALCSYFLISLSLPLLFANCLFTNSQKVVSLALGGRAAADAAGVAVAATWNRRWRHARIEREQEELAKKFANWLARVSCPPD